MFFVFPNMCYNNTPLDINIIFYYKFVHPYDFFDTFYIYFFFFGMIFLALFFDLPEPKPLLWIYKKIHKYIYK